MGNFISDKGLQILSNTIKELPKIRYLSLNLGCNKIKE
jgi:hypothetical protein